MLLSILFFRQYCYVVNIVMSSISLAFVNIVFSSYIVILSRVKSCHLPNRHRLVLPVHLPGRSSVGVGRGSLAALPGCVSPVAGDVKLQVDGVVDHPVNRRGGGHGVGEDAFPLGEDQVGRDAQRPAFVAFGDEGEKDLGLLSALGQVADIVQEQDVEVVQLAQLSGQVEVALGGEQVLHQAVGRREEDGVAGFHQAVARGAQRVGLAGAGEPEGQHVDAVVQMASARGGPAAGIRASGAGDKTGRPVVRAAGAAVGQRLLHCADGRCVRAMVECHQFERHQSGAERHRVSRRGLWLLSVLVVGPARPLPGSRGCRESGSGTGRLQRRGLGTVRCVGSGQPGRGVNPVSAAERVGAHVSVSARRWLPPRPRVGAASPWPDGSPARRGVSPCICPRAGPGKTISAVAWLDCAPCPCLPDHARLA